MNRMNTVSIHDAASGLMQLGGPAAVGALPASVREVLLGEILFQALPNLVFDQFAWMIEPFNVTPSKKIVIPYYDKTALGTELVEGTPMETDAMSMTTKEMDVIEYGKAFAISEFLKRTTYLDVYFHIAKELGRNYSETRNNEIKKELYLGTTNEVIGGGVGGYGALTTTLSAQDIKDAVEILETNNTPQINGNYICIASPHQLRGLRDDSEWLEASRYAGSGQIFKGEVGMFENVKFISTTTINTIPPTDPINTTPSGSTIHQAVMLGQEAYAVADLLDVEVRDDGVKDFQREHSLGWYAIWGQKVLNPDRSIKISTI